MFNLIPVWQAAGYPFANILDVSDLDQSWSVLTWYSVLCSLQPPSYLNCYQPPPYLNCYQPAPYLNCYLRSLTVRPKLLYYRLIFSCVFNSFFDYFS